MQHTLFPLPKNFLTIPGPAGSLEAFIAPPAEESTPIIGIICHPHPLQSGTMQNKVVSTLARAFYDLGLWSIRFNFRGVGRSTGTYDNGRGEVDDLLAITAWTQEHFPAYSLWLSGFSFGGCIALQAAAHPKLAKYIKRLITIAPALSYLHSSSEDSLVIPCPWLLIMGEADEIISVEDIKSWIHRRAIPVNAIYLPEVGHFFHGHLIELRERLKIELKNE